jgi:hypothetical protein
VIRNIFIGMLAATALFAAEQAIQLDQAPMAVQSTIQAEMQNATLKAISREADKAQTQYQVETIVNGMTRNLTIGEDGTLISVAEQVPIESVGAVARFVIEGEGQGGQISKVEKITGQNSVKYKAVILKNGTTSEIFVTPAGTLDR